MARLTFQTHIYQRAFRNLRHKVDWGWAGGVITINSVCGSPGGLGVLCGSAGGWGSGWVEEGA